MSSNSSNFNEKNYTVFNVNKKSNISIPNAAFNIVKNKIIELNKNRLTEIRNKNS